MSVHEQAKTTAGTGWECIDVLSTNVVFEFDEEEGVEERIMVVKTLEQNEETNEYRFNKVRSLENSYSVEQ